MESEKLMMGNKTVDRYQFMEFDVDQQIQRDPTGRHNVPSIFSGTGSNTILIPPPDHQIVKPVAILPSPMLSSAPFYKSNNFYYLHASGPVGQEGINGGIGNNGNNTMYFDEQQPCTSKSVARFDRSYEDPNNNNTNDFDMEMDIDMGGVCAQETTPDVDNYKNSTRYSYLDPRPPVLSEKDWPALKIPETPRREKDRRARETELKRSFGNEFHEEMLEVGEDDSGILAKRSKFADIFKKNSGGGSYSSSQASATAVVQGVQAASASNTKQNYKASQQPLLVEDTNHFVSLPFADGGGDSSPSSWSSEGYYTSEGF